MVSNVSRKNGPVIYILSPWADASKTKDWRDWSIHVGADSFHF